MADFIKYPKIPRLSRNCLISEKIDGCNVSILITDELEMFIGKRNSWCDEKNDVYGFYQWCLERKEDIIAKLGPGRFFGEFWGRGIQRNYGLLEKRVSLFNIQKYKDKELPKDFYLVPIIREGIFTTDLVEEALKELQEKGSFASPGFMNPEGVVVFHEASGKLFKKTFKDDAKGDQ